MATSGNELDAFRGKLIECQQSKKQADDELAQLLAQALQQLRSQSAEVASLRGTLDVMRVVNAKLAARIKGFEKAEARVKELEWAEARVQEVEKLLAVRAREHETMDSLRAVNAELLTRVKTLERAEARLKELEQVVVRAREYETLDALRAVNAELMARVKVLERAKEARLKELEQVVVRASQNETLDSLRAANAELMARVKVLEHVEAGGKELEIRVGEIEKMEARVREYETMEARARAKESDSLRAKVRALEEEIEGLVTRAREAEYLDARVRQLEGYEEEARGARDVVKRLTREIRHLEWKVHEPEQRAMVERMERRVKEMRKDLDEMTQQRNGLRQQLRNTLEHRGRLRQQLMEARDMSFTVMRDCLGDLNKVSAEGIPQLVNAINTYIQPELEQEGEDLVEVNPEPKIGEVMRLLADTIGTLLAAAPRLSSLHIP
ncbi:hypothetical protein CLOP_g13497 [Closterium sp. NIES-67]|nr:hypothetical protein CLOP_g13497 [Closterium sp. NIES-67]